MEIMKTTDLQIHKEALRTPIIEAKQFEALKKDIERNGQLDAVETYRGKIVDGRHRWLILQELGIEEIKVEKLPNNLTVEQIISRVHSKEIRRHETAGQLAIAAYRYYIEMKGEVTQQEAADKLGANIKRLSEAKAIDQMYKRPDILEHLFSSQKMDIGESGKPFYTDSLGTIKNWLRDTSVITNPIDLGIKPRTELTEDENIIVANILNVIRKESQAVQEEINRTLYGDINTSREG